ncbi:MAG: efflux RND transporter permease subunit, partial [Phycisphaerae bacterium]|nr:efflux RND transporter permease subunit [Phycisphaerae bacterium]
MKLTDYAVHRRLATSAIVVALVVLGLYGLWRLPVDFLPNITYPMIKVHIWWRGATPEEIDKNIADPIERQMATVDDLDYLESSSIEGMYTLQANFKYGVNVDVAYQDALAAMARVARELPKDMEPPVVIKADPSQLPVVQMTISSDQLDLVKLRTWTDEWLQDQLLAVPGVAGTEIVGGLKREIRVHLDALALEKHGLTLPEVLKRLHEENVEQFGGRVTAGPKEIIARTMGEYRNLDEIRDIVLARDAEAKLYLRDVAEVADASEEVRVITRLGGNPCVKLSVLKQANANTVEVAEAVSRRIQELGPALPEGVRLGMVENQADYVNAALGGVRNAAIEAAVLLVLIVYLFLGSWKQVLVMVLALPITLILNFGLMKLAGFSLNIFSLGGLVIAIGVLLDNSIVVIEGITRRRHERPEEPTDSVAVAATSEVGPAIVAATLSFLALFVPFLLVPGLTSLLFRELILVIAGIV